MPATLATDAARQKLPPAMRWPEASLERAARCLFCDSSAFSRLYEDLDDVTFFCAPGEGGMSRRSSCGSGYLDSRPTTDSLGRAYTSCYMHAPRAALPPRMSRLGRVRESLANGYRNFRCGAKLKPALWPGVPLIYAPPRRN